MTKLEAKLVKAALIWHAVKVFRPRYPREKEDTALRRAAIAYLKQKGEKAAAERLKMALKR